MPYYPKAGGAFLPLAGGTLTGPLTGTSVRLTDLLTLTSSIGDPPRIDFSGSDTNDNPELWSIGLSQDANYPSMGFVFAEYNPGLSANEPRAYLVNGSSKLYVSQTFSDTASARIYCTGKSGSQIYLFASDTAVPEDFGQAEINGDARNGCSFGLNSFSGTTRLLGYAADLGNGGTTAEISFNAFGYDTAGGYNLAQLYFSTAGNTAEIRKEGGPGTVNGLVINPDTGAGVLPLYISGSTTVQGSLLVDKQGTANVSSARRTIHAVSASTTDTTYPLRLDNSGSGRGIGAGVGIEFQGWDAGTAGTIAMVREGVSYAPGGMVFQTYGGNGTNNTNTLAERMRINGFGNLGVGLTNPLAKVQVYGNADNSLYLQPAPASNTNPILGARIQNAGGKYFGIAVRGGTDPDGIYDGAAADVRMVIDLNGQVGIGTLAPKRMLHVSGSAIINNVYIGKGLADVASNVAVGSSSLESTTSAPDNVAVGQYALRYTTSGSGLNVAVGNTSMQANITGDNNTAVGYAALAAVTASTDNVAIGANALVNLTTGSQNIAIGSLAGYRATGGAITTNRSSSGSIFIGYNTRPGNNAEGNQIVIGNGLLVGSGSNTTVLGNANTLSTYLGGALYVPASGAYFNGWVSIATGGVINNPSAMLDVHGNGLVTGTFTVGQATTGSNAVTVVGTISASLYVSATDFIATSDERLKRDIVQITGALDAVTALRGVTFVRDGEDTGRKMGLIAQQVLPVIPEVVGSDENGYLNIAYGNLAGVFVEAIKELKRENDNLRARLADIEKRMG